MKVRQLGIGERAVVTGYDAGDPTYRARLLAMGLTRGAVLTLVKVAPLGDPVKVEVRGYGLSLRKVEADALDVESVR
ncbi:MAG TPA: FeoA family protein [Candidatus Limnocylindrales bacterium]|jgi:ferrous iron transport protein A